MNVTTKKTPQKAAPRLDDYHIGQGVRIARVKFANVPYHAAFVGKTGEVKKLIKSRNVIVVGLDEGGEWEAKPENLEPASQQKAAPTHTPGPWALNSAGQVVLASDGTRIIANPYKGNSEPHDANARLIAAAPMLLQFVEKCNAGKYGVEDDMLKDSAALLRLVDGATR